MQLRPSLSSRAVQRSASVSIICISMEFETSFSVLVSRDSIKISLSIFLNSTIGSGFIMLFGSIEKFNLSTCEAKLFF